MSRRIAAASPIRNTADRTADGLSQIVGYQLRRAHARFVAAWLAAFRATEMPITPVQGGMLVLIDENPGLAQVELARIMGVESPTLVQSIDRLAKLGHVERSRPLHDQRAFALHLTRRGREILAQVRRFVPMLEADLLAELTPEERRQLLALLQRIAKPANAGRGGAGKGDGLGRREG